MNSCRTYIRFSIDRDRAAHWAEEALPRAKFHLAKVLIEQGKDVDEANSLRKEAVLVLDRFMTFDRPESLKNCRDEMVLFDHLQPATHSRMTRQRLMSPHHNAISTGQFCASFERFLVTDPTMEHGVLTLTSGLGRFYQYCLQLLEIGTPQCSSSNEH